MNVETANKLVKLRKQLGLSQEELAEKIGVSRQAVSKWERAESSPDTDNLIALSKIYNVSIDEMLDYNVNIIQKNNNQNDTSENTMENHNEKTKNKYLKYTFPYPIVVLIAFFLLGYLFEWRYAWLVFLTIPIWGYFVSTKKQ